MTDPIHLVVPGPLDQRTGGYLYDARIVEELRARDHTVVVHEVAGRFPDPDAEGRVSLGAALAEIPDGGVVLLDGLGAAELPDLLEEASGRLRLIGLVHHPLADETGNDAERRTALEALERRSWAATRGVIVTSRFTARRVEDFGLHRGRVQVVEPGTDRVPAPPRPSGGAAGSLRLLTVGSLVPRKGQDLLVEALVDLADRGWTLDLIGAPRHPDFAARLAARIVEVGLAERIRVRGEVEPEELEAAWAAADLFVLPSWYEGYGMALTEAAMHGLPVITTTGGAIPFTLPPAAGPQVTPGSVDELREALRTALDDPEARSGWAAAARLHAATLPSWSDQATRMLAAIDALVGEPRPVEVGEDRGDHFEAGWLALREPVDHRSRARRLTQLLAQRASEEGWGSAIDLGGGTGSNLRYLAPRLPSVHRWSVLDHDPALLARLPTLPPGSEVGEVRAVEGDLGREGLDEIGDHEVITASALLDLVSEEWLAAFVERIVRHRRTTLLTLSVDARISLFPPDEGDAEILAAVDRHQRGEKGMGTALGPAAGETAARLLAAAGCEVHTERADWVLDDPGELAMVRLLVDGWVAAASEIAPDRAGAFRRWGDRRIQAFQAGALRVEVGHLDVLAFPPDGDANG